jgi:phosphohistidine phosphatase SixA
MARPFLIKPIPTPFNFDNIAKQRNLNEKGKELAKAFGDAIRQVGIRAGEVYTSNFNRAFETAVLAGFKDIEKTTESNGGRSRRVTRRK